MRIDHVIYGVRDLPDAQRWFNEKYGLTATPGGSHPELGTANAIIPVGPGQYVELMTVVDDQVDHPLPKFVRVMTAGGDRPIGFALRPDDLDAVAARLGVAAINMHRATPDGGQVEWRIAGMEGALGAQRLPFFIDWGERAAELDAEHAAAAPDGGITTVEVGGDPDALRDWVGEALPEIVPVGGEPGVPAIHIRRGLDGLVLRAR